MNETPRPHRHPDPLVRIEAKVDAIEELLNGNGEIGLCGKVQVLWGGGLFLAGGTILAILGLFLK